MKIEDQTNWIALFKSLDFTDEIAEELELQLQELAEEAAADAPRDTGRFARGFLQPDTVVVKKEGDQVEVILTNDVPYSKYVRDEDGDIYIETAFFEKAGEVAEDAVRTAINKVVMIGRKA